MQGPIQINEIRNFRRLAVFGFTSDHFRSKYCKEESKESVYLHDLTCRKGIEYRTQLIGRNSCVTPDGKLPGPGLVMVCSKCQCALDLRPYCRWIDTR